MEEAKEIREEEEQLHFKTLSIECKIHELISLLDRVDEFTHE